MLQDLIYWYTIWLQLQYSLTWLPSCGASASLANGSPTRRWFLCYWYCLKRDIPLACRLASLWHYRQAAIRCWSEFSKSRAPKFIGFMRLRAIASLVGIQWRQWRLPVYASICCKGRETLFQTEGQSRLCYPLLCSCYSRFLWASAAYTLAYTQYQMSSLPTVWAIWFLLWQRK